MSEGMQRIPFQTRAFTWRTGTGRSNLSSIDESGAVITERRRYDGRELTITWHTGLPLDATDRVTQVYGLCLTADGRLLLVSQDGDYWTLPGGHPEPGEMPAETLAREVWEEACARVTAHQYLGAQRIVDPSENSPYYQLRYLACATLEPFRPQHEIQHRKLVDLDTAKRLLWRGESRIGTHLLECAKRSVG